ncbi:hypothetical protein [Solibacillus sp. NPDC093137]|uniref:hypothetical protein n=1 Tax=Solibacillus sp. NPDC093137 TaxID=3390678 RepID=UPI003D04150A
MDMIVTNNVQEYKKGDQVYYTLDERSPVGTIVEHNKEDDTFCVRKNTYECYFRKGIMYKKTDESADMIVHRSILKPYVKPINPTLKDMVGGELAKVITEGLDELTNAEKVNLYKHIGELINFYQSNDRWNERNVFPTYYVKIYETIDWGFKVGDKVMELSSKRSSVAVAVIKEYYKENNTFLIQKATGGLVIVRGCILTPYTEPQEPSEIEQVETINHMDLVEQLSFTF